jgi:hypothetical protein
MLGFESGVIRREGLADATNQVTTRGLSRL